jgi:protease-4
LALGRPRAWPRGGGPEEGFEIMKLTWILQIVLCCCCVAPAVSTAKVTHLPTTDRAASTEPASTPPATTRASAAAADKFPTPAELIAKMRAARKAKDALPHVAYLDLAQPLVEKPSDFSFFGDQDTKTVRSVLDRLGKARTDSQVKGVLITLSAETDLSFSQAQEIRDALAAITKAGKKTFVYADAYDTAAYTLASGASDVCMLEGGEIMIPGVGMEAMFARGLLDKIGVKADYIQIGEYKGADEQYTRTSASVELRGQMTKLTEALYGEIVDGIASHRNLPKKKVKSIIDQALLTGPVAKRRGLVDHLVDQDGLRELMSKALGGKKIELMYHYGEAQREDVDVSNPFALFAAMSKKPEPSGKPEVAVVYVDGVIKDGQGGQGMFGGSSVGSDDLRKALRVAQRDKNIKSVVLRINSPGGSALASEVIWQAARRVAETKPLVVSVGGMAASGGYYIASAGERIYADPGAIVGSIGVVGGKFVWHDLATKLGLNTETFSKGANADLFSSSHPFDQRQRKMITHWMKQTYEQFTRRVMSTRGKAIKEIDDVARGRIFAAPVGKEVGLVDEIGGFDAAVADAARRAHLKEGYYELRTLPAPKTFADLFWRGGEETTSPIRPKVQVDAGAASAIFGLLDRATRDALGQQLQALQLFQERPVQLVMPYIVTVR